ncbi:MAG: hypothetical protein K2Z81_11035 [Cyanobacteria bacterium]|nr:hypothetical protein [Cyanobacteriota bacterium]
MTVRAGSGLKGGPARTGGIKAAALKTAGRNGGVKHGGAGATKFSPQKAGASTKASGARSHSIKSSSSRHSQRATSNSAQQRAVAHQSSSPTANASAESKLSQPAVGTQSSEKTEQLYFLILKLFNPLSMALFTFSFGAGGLLSLKYHLAPIFPSYAQACSVGLLFTWIVQNLMDWMISKLDTGSCDTVSDALGMVAEVSVSIPKNGTGEVVLVLRQSRRNYPARAIDSNAELRRGTKVLIVESKGKVFFVEAYDELWLEDTPP